LPSKPAAGQQYDRNGEFHDHQVGSETTPQNAGGTADARFARFLREPFESVQHFICKKMLRNSHQALVARRMSLDIRNVHDATQTIRAARWAHSQITAGNDDVAHRRRLAQIIEHLLVAIFCGSEIAAWLLAGRLLPTNSMARAMAEYCGQVKAFRRVLLWIAMRSLRRPTCRLRAGCRGWIRMLGHSGLRSSKAGSM